MFIVKGEIVHILVLLRRKINNMDVLNIIGSCLCHHPIYISVTFSPDGACVSFQALLICLQKCLVTENHILNDSFKWYLLIHKKSKWNLCRNCRICNDDNIWYFVSNTECPGFLCSHILYCKSHYISAVLHSIVMFWTLSCPPFIS